MKYCRVLMVGEESRSVHVGCCTVAHTGGGDGGLGEFSESRKVSFSRAAGQAEKPDVRGSGQAGTPDVMCNVKSI